jgi:hypothetical protein
MLAVGRNKTVRLIGQVGQVNKCAPFKKNMFEAATYRNNIHNRAGGINQSLIEMAMIRTKKI